MAESCPLPERVNTDQLIELMIPVRQGLGIAEDTSTLTIARAIGYEGPIYWDSAHVFELTDKFRTALADILRIIECGELYNAGDFKKKAILEYQVSQPLISQLKEISERSLEAIRYHEYPNCKQVDRLREYPPCLIESVLAELLGIDSEELTIGNNFVNLNSSNEAVIKSIWVQTRHPEQRANIRHMLHAKVTRPDLFLPEEVRLEQREQEEVSMGLNPLDPNFVFTEPTLRKRPSLDDYDSKLDLL